MKHKNFLFVAALLSAAFVLQGTAAAENEWISVRSKNFHLIGNASEKEIRLVATKLEQFRETFRVLFQGAITADRIPTRVIVFKNASSYRPYKPKRPDGKPDDGIAGYFQSGNDVNYITLAAEGEKDSVYGTIFHEYVHYLVNSSLGKVSVPPWFNEGLAEYYQTFSIQNDQEVTLGISQAGHLRLLTQTGLIPLDQFFGVTNYSLHASGGKARDQFYAQAWLLMHYILQSGNRANIQNLDRFLSLLSKNVAPRSAFKEAFNSDYTAMETDLRLYVSRKSHTASIFKFPNKLTYETEMTASPLNEAMTNAYLGDLLLHTRELDSAEIHLGKALLLDPKLSVAQTSLGLVKLRQRKYAEARLYLESAIANDSTNYYAHYGYAVSISREGMDEFGFITKFPPESARRMRASLNRSLELNPQFAEGYRMLGLLSLITGEDLEKGLEAVKKALTIEPGSPDHLLMAAKIYLRQEKTELARQTAEMVSKTTDDESIRNEAENILKSIRAIDATKAEYEKQVSDEKDRKASMRAEPFAGSKPPLILKRSELTDDEVDRIENERVQRNLNRMLQSLKDGEARLVGRINKVICTNGQVRFNVTAAGSDLVFSAANLRSLNFYILHEGTRNIEVGCDSDLKNELVVITYKPVDNDKSAPNGSIVSVAFVPNDFRLMTNEELANSRYVIIEGGTATDLKKNAELVAEQQAEFETRRREAMMRQIQLALREPRQGEIRVIGSIEKVDCTGQTRSASITTHSGILNLKVPDPNELKLSAYTPDVGPLQFGCGASMTGLVAVITYIPTNDKKTKFTGELKAVEFVPSSFQLP